MGTTTIDGTRIHTARREAGVYKLTCEGFEARAYKCGDGGWVMSWHRTLSGVPVPEQSTHKDYKGCKQAFVDRVKHGGDSDSGASQLAAGTIKMQMSLPEVLEEIRGWAGRNHRLDKPPFRDLERWLTRRETGTSLALAVSELYNQLRYLDEVLRLTGGGVESETRNSTIEYIGQMQTKLIELQERISNKKG
jgi:hypothetical protein